MESNLPLKMFKNLKKPSYQFISDIGTFIVLLDNWICMGFINHGNSQLKIYLAILSFKKIKSKNLLT